MFSTFNMGLGMTAVVAPGDVKRTLEVLAARNVVAWEVGAIEAGTSGAESEAIVAP
jgi:phosphoribosylformylglycinamidine cyclo-ligase